MADSIQGYIYDNHGPLIIPCPLCQRVCWAPGPCGPCRNDPPPAKTTRVARHQKAPPTEKTLHDPDTGDPVG